MMLFDCLTGRLPLALSPLHGNDDGASGGQDDAPPAYVALQECVRVFPETWAIDTFEPMCDVEGDYDCTITSAHYGTFGTRPHTHTLPRDKGASATALMES